MSDLIDELRTLAETNIAASNRTLTVAADALESQAKRIAELEAALETERMRLAACSTAALGYYKDGDEIKEEYKSASLSGVCRLYQEVARLRVDGERLRRAEDSTGLTLYEEAADTIAELRRELAIVREELVQERHNNSRFGVGA